MVEGAVHNTANNASTIDLGEVFCLVSECAAVLAAAAERCLLDGESHPGYSAIHTLVERAVVPAVEKLAANPATGDVWNDARRCCNDAYWLLATFNDDRCDDLLLHAAERQLKSAVADLDAWQVSMRSVEVQHG